MDRQVDFLACTSQPSSSIQHKTYQQCAENSKLDWNETLNCAEDKLGTEIQLNLEKESVVVKKSGHIPTITFNEVYIPKDFFESLNDFYGVIEKKLSEVKNTEM